MRTDGGITSANVCRSKWVMASIDLNTLQQEDPLYHIQKNKIKPVLDSNIIQYLCGIIPENRIRRGEWCTSIKKVVKKFEFWSFAILYCIKGAFKKFMEVH